MEDTMTVEEIRETARRVRAELLPKYGPLPLPETEERNRQFAMDVKTRRMHFRELARAQAFEKLMHKVESAKLQTTSQARKGERQYESR